MEHNYFEHRGRRGCCGEPSFHGRQEFAGSGCCERGFRRRGGFDARHWGFGGERGGREGFGRGESRLFDSGDIKLVVLKLLGEQPSYGYQLIKTMEERLGGGYTPSAGVIYPTLTMLEEEGLASISTSDNKKVYALTDEGKQYLEANKERVDELFERIETAGQGFRRGRSPEVMRAFLNLRGAVAMRLHRQRATREEIRKIADAINAAAKAIDEM